MNASHWPEDRSKKLASFVTGGEMSYAQIAAAMNAEFGTTYSRNAMIGRAQRMGLSNPYLVKTAKHAASPKVRREKCAPEYKRAVPALESIEQVKLRCVEIEPRLVTLLDLEPNDCRYPYGDAIVLFCGHNKLPGGSSYCGPHHSLTQRHTRTLSEADHERRRRRFSGLLRSQSVRTLEASA